MRVHVLRNPAGGSERSRRRADATVGEIRGAGHDIVELTGASSKASSDAVRAAVGSGELELLLVAGGDGLVHLAIQHLAGTQAPLAIAPVGTGNDFATALGLDDVDIPVERLLTGQPTQVDLLRVTSRSSDDETWVASIAIIGFPADINARANRMSSRLGSQIYTIAAAMELPTFRRTTIELKIDGTSLTTDTAMLAIGNTSLFGGGMLACPDASATDGLLHLTSIDGVGRLGILRHLRGRSGGTADRDEVIRRQGRSIEIVTPGVALWGDGEPIATTPARIEVVPHALNVVGIPSR